MPSLGYIQKGPKIIPNEGNNGGGGSALPEVTSADAGKVLAVNNSGEWAAVSKIFNVYFDEDTGEYNLTPEQAYQLFSNKVIIIQSGGSIDPEDPTSVNAGMSFYVLLHYDSDVYLLKAVDGTAIVSESFTANFHPDY